MIHILIFLAALTTALADDFETKTQVKSGETTPTALPADGSAKLPPPAKVPKASDLALRAKVRKHAPFWIDDHSHGAAVRLNKDGTYSSEAQGGGSIAGHWKIINGELHLQTSDGAENHTYPVGGDLLIRGRKLKNGRYNLN